MASIGEIKVPVKVTFEAVQDSPELQNLLKQLIREELANLESETVKKLTQQIAEEYEKKL